jgi:hypothetical protein
MASVRSRSLGLMSEPCETLMNEVANFLREEKEVHA